jgi:ATP-dependent Lon protease
MDVIQLSGYTEEEKVGIARKYLVPKQLDAHGLSAEQVTISENTLRVIIREYTREAGVRNLERRIADLLRKAAREIAEGRTEKIAIDTRKARAWLGPRRFPADPGVATGLAYTPVGGDVLFIEATAYPGKGRLTITGQLGDVMRESAQAALSWVRSHTSELGVPENWFTEHDVHIHVPSGAVPKDGPSAGVTIATAIVSLVRGEPVAEDVGMTGEITLTGQVLPIGGLKEKALAAQRADIHRLIIPRRNEPDIDDVPANLRKSMKFVLVDNADEVLDAALERPRKR